VSEAPERKLERADEPSVGDTERGASEQLAREVARLAESKLASDLVILDVGDLVGYTDFMVVCTARNERQAKAIHDEVYERMKHDRKQLPASVEGEHESRWILMDYLDCVLHVFVPELRERYRLERLWGEAGRLEPVPEA
jgi:ribosome-associated protein